MQQSGQSGALNSLESFAFTLSYQVVTHCRYLLHSVTSFDSRLDVGILSILNCFPLENVFISYLVL